MPWSDQDASGEIAAIAIGASLWGFYNQTGKFGFNLTKPGLIGNQYGYTNLQWMLGSPVFDRARASGLGFRDWQDVITVNMLDRRFYDESGPASLRTTLLPSTRILKDPIEIFEILFV